MDTISKIRVKGVVYPIEDENAGGLELICTLATDYDNPKWTQFADCYTAEITKEEYDLLSKAMIVEVFVNPWYDTYYGNPCFATHFVSNGQISEYGEINDSGEALYVATEQYTEKYYLCATTSYFEKYILPGTQNVGLAAQFDFYK